MFREFEVLTYDIGEIQSKTISECLVLKPSMETLTTEFNVYISLKCLKI